MLFLSIDFGTSAIKMSIVDDQLRTLCWSKAEYHYLILPGEKNELRESDLMNALFQAAGAMDPELMKQVELVCYDTFSPSPVFMDKDGQLVYPNIITHMDRRSRAQTDYIDKVIGREEYMNISGIYPFAGGCSAMTMIWMKQNMPEVLERTHVIGHLPTLIHKRLTGKWMVDLVNASMMGVYETTTQGSWSKLLLKEFGLREDMFVDILNPGTVYGTLLPEIAEKLGVPAGLPVTVGTNDIASAQLGAGNDKPGGIMNTTGSSEMISILTDNPVVNSKYYLRNAAIPGQWQIYATTCGGFGIDWFYQQFCREMTREEFFAYEAQAITDYLARGYNDVTFDPYLTGDRQSLIKKTGAWHGLTLASTREEMLVAYLQAIQDVMYGTILRAERVTNLSKVIKVSGGMATEAYLKLKSGVYPGYTFETVDDCPILGTVALAQYYM